MSLPSSPSPLSFLLLSLLFLPSFQLITKVNRCVEKDKDVSFSFNCSEGRTIRFLKAHYGFTSEKSCGSDPTVRAVCKQEESYKSCNGHDKCQVEMAPFGRGECEGVRYPFKYLQMQYSCETPSERLKHSLSKVNLRSKRFPSSSSSSYSSGLQTQPTPTPEYTGVRKFYSLFNKSLSLVCESHVGFPQYPIWYSGTPISPDSPKSTVRPNDTSEVYLVAKGNKTYPPNNPTFHVVNRPDDPFDFVLQTSHVTKTTVGKYGCVRIDNQKWELVPYVVMMYEEPRCGVSTLEVELGKSVTMTCETTVWGPHWPKVLWKESEVTHGVDVWHLGGSRIRERVDAEMSVSWSTSDSMPNRTTLKATATLKMEPVDNQTYFSCVIYPHGYKWDGGLHQSLKCQSKKIILLPPKEGDQWVAGVVMGIVIFVLIIAIVLLLIYKGVICRGPRQRVMYAVQLHKQNRSVYVTCPDEPAPTPLTVLRDCEYGSGSTTNFDQ